MPRPGSSLRRRELADRVFRLGRKMPTPCSRCRQSRSDCVVDLVSGRCSNCIACGHKCDLVVSKADCLFRASLPFLSVTILATACGIGHVIRLS